MDSGDLTNEQQGHGEKIKSVNPRKPGFCIYAQALHPPDTHSEGFIYFFNLHGAMACSGSNSTALSL